MKAETIRRPTEYCPYWEGSDDICRASLSGIVIRHRPRWSTDYCLGEYDDCALFLAKALRGGNPHSGN